MTQDSYVLTHYYISCRGKISESRVMKLNLHDTVESVKIMVIHRSW